MIAIDCGCELGDSLGNHLALQEDGTERGNVANRASARDHAAVENPYFSASRSTSRR